MNDERKNKEVVFKRGWVYLAKLPDSKGSVQKGERPVVIVQNNLGNTYSPNVIVCTLTSKIGKRDLPTHVRLSGNEGEGVLVDSDVQTEQIFTLSKEDLSPYRLSKLTDRAMERVNEALKISLSLNDNNGSRHNNSKSNNVLNDLVQIIKKKSVKRSELIDLLYKFCDITGTDKSKFKIA